MLRARSYCHPAVQDMINESVGSVARRFLPTEDKSYLWAREGYGTSHKLRISNEIPGTMVLISLVAGQASKPAIVILHREI